MTDSADVPVLAHGVALIAGEYVAFERELADRARRAPSYLRWRKEDGDSMASNHSGFFA